MEVNTRSLVGAAMQVLGLAALWMGCVIPLGAVNYLGHFLGLSMAESIFGWIGLGLCLTGVGLFHQARAAPPAATPSSYGAPVRFTPGWTALTFVASLLVFLAWLWLSHRSPSGLLASAVIGTVCGVLPGLAPGRFACLKAVLLTGLLALVAGGEQWARSHWGSGATDFPGFSGAVSVALISGLLLLPTVLLGFGVGRLVRWKLR